MLSWMLAIADAQGLWVLNPKPQHSALSIRLGQGTMAGTSPHPTP